MDLPVSLVSPGGSTVPGAAGHVDVVIRCAAETTVGMVAHGAARYLADRHDHGAPLTLGVRTSADSPLLIFDAADFISQVPLHPGSYVVLMPIGAPEAPNVRRFRQPAAWVRCRTPAMGSVLYPLRRGRNSIGRDWHCAVRVTDAHIARRLGAISVLEPAMQHSKETTVSLHLHDDDLTAALTPDTVVNIAGLELSVQCDEPIAAPIPGDICEPLPAREPCSAPAREPCSAYELPSAHEQSHGHEQPFVRHLPAASMIQEPTEVTVEPPAIPTTAPRSRAMVGGMAISTAISAAAYLVTGHAAMLSMVGLSAAMSVGSWVEQWYSSRKRHKAMLQQFATDLDRWTRDVRLKQREQLHILHRYAPSMAQTYAVAMSRSPQLWSRRVSDARALRINVGTMRSDELVRIADPTDDSVEPSAAARRSTAITRYRTVPDVPVWLSLAEFQAFGCAGPKARVDEFIRAIVVQLVTWYSPGELRVAVLNDVGAAEQWLKWLPHAGGIAHSADAATILTQLETEITRRIHQAEHEDNRAGFLPAWAVVVDGSKSDQIPAWIAVAEQGAGVGVHVIWCSEEVDRLPIVCTAVLDIGQVVQLMTSPGMKAVQVDQVSGLSVRETEQVARQLAGVIDLSRATGSDHLPRHVRWCDSHPAELTNAGTIGERWTQADLSLTCTLGISEHGALDVSLRSDGPHALVAGTTGSGKSEFLQAVIMSLATRYSPAHVTFLLIDYKGGAAFAHCTRLPHTVGLVTDLQDALATRVLVSLRAELRHREHVLARYRVKDLLELQEQHPQVVLPPLVIVIDEFAALIAEVPQFIDGVVDIAQRGRSLGLHLIMATQRPAGVIRDNVRANTSLRIALRVADEDDSVDVIGSADAAYIDRSIPGRGYLSTGPRTTTAFQSTYLGGSTASERETNYPRIEPFPSLRTRAPEPARRVAVSDMDRLVDGCVEAAAALHISPARRPWLEPLGDVLSLETLWQADSECADDSCSCLTSSDVTIVWGRVDRPHIQRQACLQWSARSRHLLVTGKAGAGKSTAIQTMAAVICHEYAMWHRRVEIYVIAIDPHEHVHLAAMPSVGNVIEVGDVEMIDRLALNLQRRCDDGIDRFILIDGFEEFIAHQDSRPSDPARVEIPDLMRRSGTSLRVLATASHGLSHQQIYAEMFAMRVELSHGAAEPGYDISHGPQEDDPPPGRCLYNGDMAQIAVGAGSAAADRIVEQLRLMDAHAVAPIPRIPTVITAKEIDGALGLDLDLDRTSDDDSQMMVPGGLVDVPVGLYCRDVSVATIDLSGIFVLCGPAGSGRTTLLHAILQRIGRVVTRPVFLGMSDRSLPSDIGLDWKRCVTGPLNVESSATDLIDVLQGAPLVTPMPDLTDGIQRAHADSVLPDLTDSVQRAHADSVLPDLIVMADAHEAAETTADDALARLISVTRSRRVPVIVELDSQRAASAWQIWTELKTAPRGIVLCPDDLDPAPPIQATLPQCARSDFPVGRGFVIGADTPQMIQCALPRP